MKFWWFFRPRWLWPEVEWNVISSPQNGKGHMWSQSDIISDQNIYQIEKKIYDVCINIYLKLGDLGHMSVSCVSGFLSEWDFEKNHLMKQMTMSMMIFKTEV